MAVLHAQIAQAVADCLLRNIPVEDVDPLSKKDEPDVQRRFVTAFGRKGVVPLGDNPANMASFHGANANFWRGSEILPLEHATSTRVTADHAKCAMPDLSIRQL